MKIKLLMVAIVLFMNNDSCGTDNVHEITFSIDQENKAIAQAYYTAMAEKNIVALEKYLDEDVLFVAPLATCIGKQDFLERVQEFFACSAMLTIDVVFSSHNQAMVVFTLNYPAPIGIVEAAALLNIDKGLIKKIQLFYDAHLFDKK